MCIKHLWHSPIYLEFELKLQLSCCKCIRKNKALIIELSKPAPGSKDLYFPTRYSQSFFTQCMALLMETTLVLLVKPTLHCFKNALNNCHSLDIWDSVLGPCLLNVSYYILEKNFKTLTVYCYISLPCDFNLQQEAARYL